MVQVGWLFQVFHETTNDHYIPFKFPAALQLGAQEVWIQGPCRIQSVHGRACAMAAGILGRCHREGYPVVITECATPKWSMVLSDFPVIGTGVCLPSGVHVDVMQVTFVACYLRIVSVLCVCFLAGATHPCCFWSTTCNEAPCWTTFRNPPKVLESVFYWEEEILCPHLRGSICSKCLWILMVEHQHFLEYDGVVNPRTPI